MTLKCNNIISKSACRVFHGVFKVSMYFLPWKTPQVLRGVDSSAELPHLIKKLGYSKPLIVTGPNVRRHGLLDKMLDAMTSQQLNHVIFDGSKPDPTDIDVNNGLLVFKEHACDCIIAFGGGSPMDCAKGIAALAVKPGKTVKQLQGLLKIHKKTPPIFAVPTTSGTGSETTIAAVITESATHHKASISDICLMPKVAVLDPNLTKGLPAATTATTGFDALCHAVECYTNKIYNTKLENQMAETAVKLIYDNLYTAYSDGNNLEARQKMQDAAFYAGRAFTRGCVGYVHAIGHAIGSLYGISHGLAMAVILPTIMREFGECAEERLAKLADICGISGKNSREKAAAFIDWMDDLKDRTGIPRHFDMIDEKDFPQIIDWVLKEVVPLYPVPKIWGERELGHILLVIKGE